MVQLQATGEAIERLLHRGVAQVEKEADLRRLLLEGNRGEPLLVKLGVDPSHYDLTIGHAVVFRKLRQFQQMGHKTDLDGRCTPGEEQKRRSPSYPAGRRHVLFTRREWRSAAHYRYRFQRACHWRCYS